VKNVQEPAERVVANVERVIVGKHLEVRMALVALLCEGHILIEDVPGVGKTMLAKAISRSSSTSSTCCTASIGWMRFCSSRMTISSIGFG
jgi:MoxR-like ATPase